MAATINARRRTPGRRRVDRARLELWPRTIAGSRRPRPILGARTPVAEVVVPSHLRLHGGQYFARPRLPLVLRSRPETEADLPPAAPLDRCTQRGCRCVEWLNREVSGSAQRGASFGQRRALHSGLQRVSTDVAARARTLVGGRSAARWHPPAVSGGQSRIVTVAGGHHTAEPRRQVVPAQRTRSRPGPASSRSSCGPPSRGHAGLSSGSSRRRSWAAARYGR